MSVFSMSTFSSGVETVGRRFVGEDFTDDDDRALDAVVQRTDFHGAHFRSGSLGPARGKTPGDPIRTTTSPVHGPSWHLLQGSAKSYFNPEEKALGFGLNAQGGKAADASLIS
jgi:hypothetical protein